MGNEAICVGHRRYIHFFACFLFLNTLIRQITRIALWALLLEEIGNVGCGVWGTDYLR